MLVSPTEPTELKKMGTVSSVPERYGADFLFVSPVFGLVGVQRKEIKDLVASVKDGRLAKELGQMKQLGLALLIVEGRPQWSNDGLLITSSTQWTRSQHLGTLWSISLQGCWIVNSSDLAETSDSIYAFTRWTAKPRHTIGSQRESPTSDEWGKVGSREWELHLLQGFRGIGPVQAAAILDYFGKVPLEWQVGVLDFLEVPGIGPVRAENLMEALRG